MNVLIAPVHTPVHMHVQVFTGKSGHA